MTKNVVANLKSGMMTENIRTINDASGMPTVQRYEINCRFDLSTAGAVARAAGGVMRNSACVIPA